MVLHSVVGCRVFLLKSSISKDASGIWLSVEPYKLYRDKTIIFTRELSQTIIGISA